MRKRVIVISLVVFLLVLLSFFIINAVLPNTYSSAKKDSERFLNRNRDELTEIAVGLLKNTEDNHGYYKEHYYSYSTKESDLVRFEVDAQGMLGGQYWSLIYTDNGCFHDEADEYLYKESDGGNNIIRAEQLDDHWWFYWIDYDGTEKSYK